MLRALAYANGVICFSRTHKPETLPIARGPAPKLREAVEGLARRSYDRKSLLVPWLPEARNWEERSAALVRFTVRVEQALGNGKLQHRIESFDAKRRAP